MKPVITSLIDQDMYKFGMGQAILFGRYSGVHYQLVDAAYEFINRDNRSFPIGFSDLLKEQIMQMETLRFSNDELDYLSRIRYIKPGYVDFLSSWRWDSRHINVSQINNTLKVSIKGPWYKTVYYEVPLMAIISELYFEGETRRLNDFDRASLKSGRLSSNNCHFSDFGTRRRHSLDVHKSVVSGLVSGDKNNCFMGTSNVLIAKEQNIVPIGTHAHEFFQAHACLFGYRNANRFALEAWAEEYDGDLGIALSDTFTSDVFLRNFSRDLAKMFDGVRHDSGDPIKFAEKIINHYTNLKIDPKSKTIVFSDAINVDRAIEINQWCDGKIKCAFGIGTHFTNDVGLKPLNMVIKLTECNGVPAVKLSDVAGKHTGTQQAIDSCKFQLGIHQSN